jgi:PAS domain S-box-containing protein
MQPANIESETGVDSSPEQVAQALLNLRCAVDHCHDAVLMTDRDGRIELVNHSLEALIGFSASEVTGRNISSLTEGKSAIDHHNSIVEKVVAEGICRATMEIHSRHDGGVMLDFTVVAVRDRDGSIANLMYTGKDLTEERALQPELAQARDLQTVATLAGVLSAANGKDALHAIETHSGKIDLTDYRRGYAGNERNETCQPRIVQAA